MGSGNWIIDNIANALEVWNAKLAEIWVLLVQTPENFKGGAVWDVITDIHGALQAVGYALLVLFFLVGVVMPRELCFEGENLYYRLMREGIENKTATTEQGDLKTKARRKHCD